MPRPAPCGGSASQEPARERPDDRELGRTQQPQRTEVDDAGDGSDDGGSDRAEERARRRPAVDAAEQEEGSPPGGCRGDRGEDEAQERQHPSPYSDAAEAAAE